MKVIKKAAFFFTAAAMILPMCAFIRTNIGVNIKDSDGKMTVFKEVMFDERSQDEISDDDKSRFLTDVVSSNDWKWETIEKYEDDKHFGGIHMEKQSPKNLVTTYLEIADSMDSDFSLSTKTSIGSKTVTVKVKPTVSQSSQAYSDYFGYGKGEDDEYYLVLKVPGKVISTNGEVLSGKKTVRWDIKDATNADEKLELTVKYKAFGLSWIIIVIVIAVIALICVALRNKNTITVDEDEISFPRPEMIPKPSEDSNAVWMPYTETNDSEESDEKMKPYSEVGSVNDYMEKQKKCPECGGDLVDNGTYCEHCGMFF